MNYDTVIFDLDGTILDTLEDLKDSLNFALGQSGFAERSLDEVRSFVGNGIRKLIERSVPKGAQAKEIDKVHSDFTARYALHCAEKTKPYDGVTELLASLREKGFKTAVVSNKADYAVKSLCETYFKDLFDCAVGESEGVRRKPAPDSVNAVLEKLGAKRERTVYIGDSDVDIKTAQNAGIDSITVEWGFRDRGFLIKNGAKILVKEPREILDIICKTEK